MSHRTHSHRVLGALMATVLLFTAAPLAAQQPTNPQLPQQQLPDSVQEMMAEFQEKQERLQTLQEEAIEGNDALQEQQNAIQAQIEEAMRALEPDFDQLLERLESMEAEAQEAQEAEDTERLQSIMAEAQAVNGRLQQAERQAFEREEIQEAVESFQDDLMTQMKEIDPEAEELVDELEALAERLDAAMPAAPR